MFKKLFYLYISIAEITACSTTNMNEKLIRLKAEILRQFYYSGQLACSELSELTHRSLPYTTRLIGELSDEGLVQEMGLANSTGGRRPQNFGLQPDSFYLVCVAMDQLLTRVSILDLHNQQAVAEQEFHLHLAGNDHSLQELADLLTDYINHCGIGRQYLAGVGIGMPGFIDVQQGINHSFLTAPPGESVVSYLRKRLNLPVYIDNDSSLVALAESKFGEGCTSGNCMIINIGWGVGLGMVLNGKLFRGNNGFAGEFSHIPLFTNNKLCSCGKLGCLETETSMLVLVEKASLANRSGVATRLPDLDGLSAEDALQQVMEAALHGDQFVLRLLDEIGYSIGRGIAILIHLLNPSLVVLSGRGAVAGNLWLPSVQKAINEHCIPRIAEKTTVSVSRMGKAAELVGAACLIMEHIHDYYKDSMARGVRKKAVME